MLKGKRICGDMWNLTIIVQQVEAYRGQIIMPNRHEEAHGNMFEGHLLASETYVGGHVEALEAGVFRSDIATDFKIVPEAAQKVGSHNSRIVAIVMIALQAY